ncbi:RNA-splicing factor [Paecilomyces lecythidis]|uniref:RNA-splicing factor n=1 Tax=Paecilomyces lecythidis TaxID=3004212 RepID=A0ABR3WZG0_9EURO
MSSNVGLSTPRGSGTSGYVQRNAAFLKPRDAGYGAPYPPVSGSNGPSFKQRKPDQQILDHDRKRAIEVKVMEERERLEEENERIEEELKKSKGKKKSDDEKETKGEEKKVLSEDEIDERCEELRQRLLRELEEEGSVDDPRSRRRPGRDAPPRERKQFKAYQVHEQAEAKIQESERLRRALGIRDDWESAETDGRRYAEKESQRQRDLYPERPRDRERAATQGFRE